MLSIAASAGEVRSFPVSISKISISAVMGAPSAPGGAAASLLFVGSAKTNRELVRIADALETGLLSSESPPTCVKCVVRFRIKERNVIAVFGEIEVDLGQADENDEVIFLGSVDVKATFIQERYSPIEKIVDPSLRDRDYTVPYFEVL